MNTALLFLVLVLAVASGWWMGVTRKPPARPRNRPPPNSLDDLLRDQPDAAIESFIQALDVRADTLETHLALGTILRRRGEVDRAIRIHQNLLRHTELPPELLTRIQLELGRDYAASGWLDRAEKVFLDILAVPGPFEAVALQQLVPLYESEREWVKALQSAQRLLEITGAEYPGREQLQVAAAHYNCELAEMALARGDTFLARRHAEDAQALDRVSLRATRVMIRISLLQDPGEARKVLDAYVSACPTAAPELLDLAVQVYQPLGKQAYGRFLSEALEAAPSAIVLHAYCDWLQENQGDAAAAAFVAVQVRQRPSLRGVRELVRLHAPAATGQARENLALLGGLVDALLGDKPDYQCHHCGFSGRTLYWQCPGCKAWGTIERIRGTEGD